MSRIGIRFRSQPTRRETGLEKGYIGVSLGDCDSPQDEWVDEGLGRGCWYSSAWSVGLRGRRINRDRWESAGRYDPRLWCLDHIRQDVGGSTANGKKSEQGR